MNFGILGEVDIKDSSKFAELLFYSQAITGLVEDSIFDFFQNIKFHTIISPGIIMILLLN